MHLIDFLNKKTFSFSALCLYRSINLKQQESFFSASRVSIDHKTNYSSMNSCFMFCDENKQSDRKLVISQYCSFTRRSNSFMNSWRHVYNELEFSKDFDFSWNRFNESDNKLIRLIYDHVAQKPQSIVEYYSINLRLRWFKPVPPYRFCIRFKILHHRQ